MEWDNERCSRWNDGQFFLNECDGVDLESGAKPGVKPGVEKLEPWARAEQASSPTPLTSSRPERLERLEQLFWTGGNRQGPLIIPNVSENRSFSRKYHHLIHAALAPTW
jgi:hypothetical protein